MFCFFVCFLAVVALQASEFRCSCATNKLTGKCKNYFLHSTNAVRSTVEMFDMRVSHCFQLPANTLNVVVEDVQHYYRNGMTYLFFRVILCSELINGKCFCNGRHSLVYHKRGSKNCSIMTAVPKDVRFNGQGHSPCTSTMCKRCQWCSTTSQETRTKLVCRACQVPLCLGRFEPFYKKL